MCGRYTLTNPDPAQLRARFELDPFAELDERPRFNIAPTDPVLAIRAVEVTGRAPGTLRWGLLPGHWALEGGRPLINARAETVAEQPAFKDSFRHRRCLIPADGFYEWREDEGRGRQAVWLSRPDAEPFAFAGIWAALELRDGSTVHSCAIVTCEPNDLVRPIHDRMPVILAPETEGEWISPGADPAALRELMRPVADDVLGVRDVGDAVNDVREDGPHLLAPPLTLF